MNILEAPVYSQRDPLWVKNHYGLPRAATSSTIGAYGCAITCIAQKLTLLGFTTTPLEVQARMAANQGFKRGGSSNFVDWPRIPLLFPQLKYLGRHDLGSAPAPKRIMDAINLRVQLNDPPIIYVDAERYKGGLQQHFVLAVSIAQSGTLIIANPWNGMVQDLRPYADTDAQAVRGLIALDLNIDRSKTI
ncbi:hypothetical protein TFLX_03128 [Thermoflexales bacterium]|nr:hypothetical protein TFLX_03128 [Thermoflexales bacterium]